MNQKQNLKHDIEHKAVSYLTRREHGYLELRTKLIQKFGSEPLIDQVMQQLVEQDLQSDLRFVHAYTRHHSSRGCGKRTILHALQARIREPGNLIEQINAMGIDWLGIGAKLAAKKQTSLLGTSNISRRLEKYLWNKGYEVEQIEQIMMSLQKG